MIYPKVFEAKPNEYYNIDHYDYVIRDNQEGYTIGDNEEIKPLFYLIKGGIKNPDKYKEIINKLGKSKTKNRGSASGVCDIKQFPKGAVKLVCPKTHKELEEGHKYVSVKYEDSKGKVCSRCQSNIKRSACAGYFDNVGALPCRAVGWTQKNPDKQKVLVELAEDIDAVFKETNKEYYEKQKKLADMKPQFRLGETIFSTQTINYDFRTACHKDKGDFKEGLSTLTIFEEIPNNYYGFYLGLPEYKICFDLRDGDILIFDAHEYHCNTEYLVQSDKLPKDDLTGEPFAGRCGVVSYLRNRLWKCKDNKSHLTKFVIKTKERVELLRDKTYKLLKSYNIEDNQINLFVSSEKDLKEYKEGYSNCNVILGPQGIANIDNFIVDYFKEGEEYVYMNDDVSEIQEIEIISETPLKLKKKRVEDINILIGEIFKELKDKKYSYGGIHPVDNALFMYKKKDKISYDLNLIMDPFSCIINNKNVRITEMKVPDYPNFRGECSDTEKTIQHFRDKGGIVRFNKYCMKVQYFGKVGGFQGRTFKIVNWCCNELKRLYPEYISSVKEKSNGWSSVRLKRRKCIAN